MFMRGLVWFVFIMILIIYISKISTQWQSFVPCFLPLIPEVKMSTSDNSGWTKGFSSFDLFPKLSDEARVKTYSGTLFLRSSKRESPTWTCSSRWHLCWSSFHLTGAIVSIVAIVCIFALLISEFLMYLNPERVDRLYVDHTSRTQMLPISFDISFPHIPCPLLTLQTMDVAGTSQLDIDHTISKRDILPNGEVAEARFTYV